MKRIRLIMCLVLALTLCAGLCGCVSFNLGPVVYSYANASAYTVGGGVLSEEELMGVDTVVIDWVRGSVSVRSAADGETGLSVSEESASELTEQWTLHRLVDGDTLYIRFCRAGVQTFGVTPDKDLTVLVPASLSLDKVQINSASAPVTCALPNASRVTVDSASGDVVLTHGEAAAIDVSTASGDVTLNAAGTIGRLKADTASGDVKLTLACGADDLRLNATSGSIEVEAAGAIGHAEIDTASGDVTLTGTTVGSLEADSASGKVTVNADEIGDADVETASGRVFIGTDGFRSLEVDTASGNVTLSFPVTLGFTLELDHMSGDLKCDNIPLIRKGSTYTSGDGSRRIEVDTASGDLIIMGRE